MMPCAILLPILLGGNMYFYHWIFFLLLSLPSFCMNSPSKFLKRKIFAKAKHPSSQDAQDYALRLIFDHSVILLRDAIAKGDIKTAEFLLKEDGDMLANTPRDGFNCPLVSAINAQDLNMVQLLIKYDAYVNAKSTISINGSGISQQSCLGLAYKNQCFIIAQILIENGAELLPEEISAYGYYYCKNLQLIDSRYNEILPKKINLP